MDRDATFLFALVMLAVASLAVSTSGWILFARDRRAWKTAAGAPDAVPDATPPEAHEGT
jgi:hypothetical protein